MIEPRPHDQHDSEPALPVRQEIVPAQVIPDFRPVPRKCDRSNGWKPEVQRAFIEALAETGSVKSACRRVGRAEVGVYLLRRHPEAEEFRRAWDAALDIGMRRIEDVAMDRDLNGHQQPVYSYGKLVGERTVYNDGLLMFMLRNRAPERFGGALSRNGGATRDNAVDKMERDRLRKRWRKEWEAERDAEIAKDATDIYKSIDTKLSAQRQRWLQSMSPRVRTLYRAYEVAQREESQGRRPEELPLLPGVQWPNHSPREMDEAEWEELIELDKKGIEPR